MISRNAIYKTAPIMIIPVIWLLYASANDIWYVFLDNWFMSVTMVFGSFIAGASSEGGGAVAFPVMTLIFNIPPDIARNFGLAIQSIGMTAASYLILIKGIKVEYKYLWFVSLGGIFGMVLGSLYIAPLVPAAYAKMLFVSFWLSFGVVLFYVNEIYRRKTIDELPQFNWPERLVIIFIGIIGGSISSLLGSGLDIFSFSYVTMRYHLSEKVATPTSVIVMAFNSIVGFFLHAVIIKDFGQAELNYWLVCIPVVVIGAPVGAYFINRRTRGFIARFLYLVILVQFVGALFIIKPGEALLYFSIAAFAFGMIVFFGFAWLSKKIKFLR
ncbi:MAG: sulfite exporter TauE/SafE family protein [Cytophagales bacterium]|nr:sulfite exporter TauE/SafE family protein [Cytophagales bacterium]